MYFPSLVFVTVAVRNHHKPEDLKESHFLTLKTLKAWNGKLPSNTASKGSSREPLAYSCIAPISALLPPTPPVCHFLLSEMAYRVQSHIPRATPPPDPQLRYIVLETRSASQKFWCRPVIWRQLLYPGWNNYLVHIRMKSSLLYGSLSVSGGPIY